MKFGLHYLLSCAANQSPVQRYRDTIDQAVQAEALGFESVWPVEHHFDPNNSISPCPTLLLSAIAARTRTLRLGTAIVQLGLCHPLRVAEEIATLDVLSDGRVELGVGRGGNPAHFAGYQVPLAESRARSTEALAFLRRALHDERFSFEGTYFRAQDVQLAPRPVRRPTMHFAANSVESAVQAGALGLPILIAVHVQTFAKLGELLHAYRGARVTAGCGPAAPHDISVVVPLYVAETSGQIERELGPSVQHFMQLLARLSESVVERCTDAAERAKLEGMLARMRNSDLASVNANMGIFETPRACAERLHALRDEHGIGRVIGWFNMGGLVSHASVLRSMELFATRVMPALAMREAA
jgi:alkanesulfonate monooxygenase SsuD/methylene tetrahydromethanopterin reductase-like flavin-dependent oxidoreductase (luciferase family)